MDKNLENKLDEMMRTIKVGFDEVHEKFDQMDKRFDAVATKEDLQKFKLEAVDKYATLEKVNDHEVRIKKLESKIA